MTDVPDHIREMTLSQLGLTVMSFGKYGPKHPEGPHKFDDIPLKYLEWLHNEGICRGDLGYKLAAYMAHPRTCQELAKLEEDD